MKASIEIEFLQRFEEKKQKVGIERKNPSH